MTKLVAFQDEISTLYAVITSVSLALLLLYGVVLLLQNGTRSEKNLPQQALGISLLLRAGELAWALFLVPQSPTVLPTPVLSLVSFVFGCYCIYPLFVLHPRPSSWGWIVALLLPPLLFIPNFPFDMRPVMVVAFHLAQIYIFVRSRTYTGSDASLLRFYAWGGVVVLGLFDLALFYYPLVGGILHRLAFLVLYTVTTYRLCFDRSIPQNNPQPTFAEEHPEPVPAPEDKALHASQIGLSERLTLLMEKSRPELDTHCTLGFLACELGVSAPSLSACIHKMGFANFQDYINQRRVQTFKERVQQNRYTSFSALEKIATELGFGSLRSFFRAFTRYEGQSPSEYLRSKLSPDLPID
jgi:AraC-like DNA-binding protein